MGPPSRRQIEIRDPLTGAWRLGPAAQEDRAYHSTALLLPDGRVFTGGDDQNGGSLDGMRDGVHSDQGEVYEPWYYGLPRPVLTSVPMGIDYGKSYSFDAAGVTKMVLMAASAVTHANDMNARRVELRPHGGLEPRRGENDVGRIILHADLAPQHVLEPVGLLLDPLGVKLPGDIAAQGVILRRLDLALRERLENEVTVRGIDDA